MSADRTPRLFSIPPGTPFLPTLADALFDGTLVPGVDLSDPLALADTTVYVPTRRAARRLRALFAEREGSRPAVLPVIRPLGEFDEETALFDGSAEDALALAPPIPALDRLMLLAPLVQRWQARLPQHVAALFDNEEIVVPASTADAIWLALDLAALMDEVETEGSDWAGLVDLAGRDLSEWWQVTLSFLEIVTRVWPDILAERRLSDPAAHRNALIRAEAARLAAHPPRGPVIAAGSTGSIPATAELLSAICRLERGAVVLPGLDTGIDERSWRVLGQADEDLSVLGHPQYGLARLLGRLRAGRPDVIEIGKSAPRQTMRARVLAEALRPAETTDDWADLRRALPEDGIAEAFAAVTLVEAANERDEALAIAVALRHAVEQPGHRAALVSADRALARRVAAELARFGIQADDSGGTPLDRTPPAELLRLMVEVAFRPGDPVAILALLKHPLLRLGLDRAMVRRAAGTVELAALRGGTGRPDIATLAAAFETRLAARAGGHREPPWLVRLDSEKDEARRVLDALRTALEPLICLRGDARRPLGDFVEPTVRAFEALGVEPDGTLAALYAGDAGAALAEALRGLVAAQAPIALRPDEWPDVLAALLAPETVKPAPGADRRIVIWGALEARLQDVDTLVIGGLNEGTWPSRPRNDRFLSRVMKTGIGLEPPERRIGLAAHDFMMAMGTPAVVLTRSARSGDAPAVASRWLQRLTTFLGTDQTEAMGHRGRIILGWAAALDTGAKADFAPRPEPRPPVAARPRRFSVTEIETLRRDPYAVYARRILDLVPLEPLLRDPGAAERGTLFHDILHRFSASGVDPFAADALERLVGIGRERFAEEALPPDVEAVWWPRFLAMAGGFVGWERQRGVPAAQRHPELRASATPIGRTDATLSGYADRIDRIGPKAADILDYKTGSTPSRKQAHTLLSPQLALEGALLRRGAFRDIGALEPAELAYVRLRPNGAVEQESVLKAGASLRSAEELSEDAWSRLEELIRHYDDPSTGYLSRALPFKEGDADGDYDHLARVLEWSAGAENGSGEDG